jgi:hypothetical protein
MKRNRSERLCGKLLHNFFLKNFRLDVFSSFLAVLATERPTAWRHPTGCRASRQMTGDGSARGFIRSLAIGSSLPDAMKTPTSVGEVPSPLHHVTDINISRPSTLVNLSTVDFI